MSSYLVGVSSVLYRPSTLSGGGSGAGAALASGAPPVSASSPPPVAAAVTVKRAEFFRNSRRRRKSGSGVISELGGWGRMVSLLEKTNRGPFSLPPVRPGRQHNAGL